MDVNLEVNKFYLNGLNHVVHIVDYTSSKVFSYVDQIGRIYKRNGKCKKSDGVLDLKSEYKEHLENFDDSAVEGLHVSEPKKNTMIDDWLNNFEDGEINKQVIRELVELHFPEIVEERIKKIQNTLTNKAKEYATNGQSFYNFDRAAEINRTSAKQALWGMATKHLVSVIDMVEQDKSFDEAYIDEKIGDMVNYLILLEGLLKRDLEE